MKIYLDDSIISFDIKKATDKFQDWYKKNKQYGYTIETEKGSIDFSPKSIARITLKMAMAPIVPPMLRMMYKLKHAEPRKHEKHEDLLDYFVLTSIAFFGLFNEDAFYVKTAERAESNERFVVSVATLVPATGIEGATTEKEIEAGGTGGEAHVRRGQDGHGQDEIDKGDYQEENADTALA